MSNEKTPENETILERWDRKIRNQIDFFGSDKFAYGIMIGSPIIMLIWFLIRGH